MKLTANLLLKKLMRNYGDANSADTYTEIYEINRDVICKAPNITNTDKQKLYRLNGRILRELLS